jgi:hypothetical protein
LPLNHFDVLLGYDWMEEFSPMKVHWAEKWIDIPYATGTVVLKGIFSSYVLVQWSNFFTCLNRI